MAYDQNTVHILYKKLLTLYPRAFREQFGESIEQTVRDLYNDQKGQSTSGFFTLSIFTETVVGIVREHLFLFMEGGIMILLLINFTWGGLIVEEIYSLRGIRCD